MSGFQVPFSSSPPSTPKGRNKNGAKRLSFGASNPSTTPAGPPPSSAGSFTPAGPPPSSVLGSSRLDPEYNNQPFPSLRFSQESVPEHSASQYGSPGSSPVAPYVRSANIPKAQTGQRKLGSFSAELYDEENEDEEDRPEDEDNYSSPEVDENSYESAPNANEFMEDDGSYEDERHTHDPKFNNHRSESGSRPLATDYLTSSQPNMPRRSIEEDLMDFHGSAGSTRLESKKDYIFGRIAKDMYNQMGTPSIEESDDLVLRTEELMIQLYDEGIKDTKEEDTLKQTLAIISTDLLKLWADYSNATAAYVSEEYVAAIEPGPRASCFTKANFLASLLLKLYHQGPTSLGNAESFRINARRSSISLSSEGKIKQIPLLLLEWMDDHHDPYPSQLDEIQNHKPSPANHRLFWDTILNSLLRGRVVAVVNALRTAGWRHAKTATDNGRNNTSQLGYTGVALNNIEKVIHDAMQVLQHCPAMRGNWNVKGSDWTLFRVRVEQTLENLKQFAQGRHRNNDLEDSFAANGLQSYTGVAQKAESQVPWDIYQNLLTLYNLILGDASAIIENSQDWCEATIGLAVWWNPSKDGRESLRHSPNSAENIDSRMYMQRLQNSFDQAISESTDFQVNTLDPIEVGLASIFEGNIEAVVGFLRAWSGPISSTVVEVAGLGGWLPRGETQSLISIGSLDQDDMNLLGINPVPEQIQDIKDSTLIVYAEAIARRGQLYTVPSFGHPKMVREGWEVAIEILGRLDSVMQAEEEVGHLLENFPFDSDTTVDKLLKLLNDLGMTTHAENIAEKYADSLSNNTHKYGEALWYFSFAHKPKRVKDVLDLLISFSLIYSMAYPPEADMDSHLARLISSPRSTLTEISKVDFEAAQLLHKMLSGYATLRKFYDLRDDETKLSAGQKPKLGADVRKREATAALLAVVTSSDDNIRGGLYDEARGAVVSVDFLLALLGEAMVFVNQPQPGITPSQINILLKAIEDLQTVPAHIYGVCNEFFNTVVASTQGLKGSSPMDLLKRSTSNISGTSSFSLVGSSMLASQLQRSIGDSAVLVKANVKRGWDWRKGLTANTTGQNILQMLRLGLAKDLARAWIMEADGQL